MKPIILVRHAEPELPREGAASHWTDTELSELGRSQAQAVAERLRDELGDQPCEIHSSDLKRAAQTADAIAGELSLPVLLEPGLREFNNGLGVGGTEEELRRCAESASQAEADLSRSAAGESWEAFFGRVATTMERIVSERDPDKVLIIAAHYGANMHIVSWWLAPGLRDPAATTVAFNHHLSGVSTLAENNLGKRTLVQLNDVSHLLLRGIPLRSRGV